VHDLSDEAYAQEGSLHRNMPSREAFPDRPSLAIQ
jgi:hypothetical protein